MYNKENAREEFVRSKEEAILKSLSGKLPIIFDVGSNIGEWTRLAREFHSNSQIHLFEIVPNIYKQQLSNITVDSNTIVNGFGLSDKLETVNIRWYRNYGATSTTLLDLHFMSEHDAEIVQNITVTGDIYAKSRKIDYIDFLKIDTEGAEPKVLIGFSEMLNNNKIGIIQFEMGLTNIINKWLLIDFYKLLEPLGFKIAILPWNKEHQEEQTRFKPYEYLDEIKVIPGANVLAVHSSKLHLFGV